MPELHSKFGASTADRYMQCPGSMVLAADAARSTSKYAAEGTAAHQVLTWALQDNQPASAYLGKLIDVDAWTFEVDADMVGHVQTCIDYTKALQGDDGVLFVDTQVNYAEYLGVDQDQAWGTLDVGVVRGDELAICDLKYGQGVEVSAVDNRQLKLYALGMLRAVREAGLEVDRVRLSISQPRVKTAPSEWDISVADLEAWGYGEARSAVVSCVNAANLAAHTDDSDWQGTFLNPGEKQCKFCPAKATCPALRAEVAEMVGASAPCSPDDFLSDIQPTGTGAYEAADWLAACLSKVDLIEDWCKAVRAEAERRLQAGEPVPGFKLVQGKRGSRAWSDAAAAEEALKAYRLKIEEMYDLKLISPTSAEKLAKAKVIGPRQWPKLQALITQLEGKPHVAPADDPRPAIIVQPVDEAFEVQADDIC